MKREKSCKVGRVWAFSRAFYIHNVFWLRVVGFYFMDANGGNNILRAGEWLDNVFAK